MPPSRCSKQIGEPAEIANACLLLASDEASCIPGEILAVSGASGRRCNWPFGASACAIPAVPRRLADPAGRIEAEPGVASTWF